jgi:hypothetical protein
MTPRIHSVISPITGVAVNWSAGAGEAAGTELPR